MKICSLAQIGTYKRCVKIGLKFSSVCENVRKPQAAGGDFCDSHCKCLSKCMFVVISVDWRQMNRQQLQNSAAKISPLDCCSTSGKRQNPNEDEYQKSVSLTFRHCLDASQFQECDGASQYPHPSDADFMCKIRRIRMRICHAIKNTSHYSYCNSTQLF